MDSGLLSIIIIDGALFVIGLLMSITQKKFKIDKKHVDIVWKLVEYVTMALVGYQLGGGIK